MIAKQSESSPESSNSILSVSGPSCRSCSSSYLPELGNDLRSTYSYPLICPLSRKILLLQAIQAICDRDLSACQLPVAKPVTEKSSGDGRNSLNQSSVRRRTAARPVRLAKVVIGAFEQFH